MPILVDREILASGTWPGSSTIDLDDDDLDCIVDAFNARGDAMRLPLKLGHDGPDVRYDENPLRQFALGWVQKIRRAGSRLLANISVNEKVKQAIDEGYLKFVSVELLKNVQAGNRVLPWVLDAVALLGTDQPAVGILKDLQALTLRRSPSLRAGSSRITLSTGSRQRETSTEEIDMDKAEVERITREAVALATKPLTERLELAEKSAKEANEALAKERDEKKKDSLKLKRESIDELFNAAIEAGGIKPNVRESYVKLTKFDKNDNALEEITIKEVKDYIEENTDKVALAAKKKEKEKALATQQGQKDEDEGKPADVRLNNRVKKIILSRNKDHNDAGLMAAVTLEVLREDPELAKAYRDSPTNAEDARIAAKGGK